MIKYAEKIYVDLRAQSIILKSIKVVTNDIRSVDLSQYRVFDDKIIQKLVSI